MRDQYNGRLEIKGRFPKTNAAGPGQKHQLLTKLPANRVSTHVPKTRPHSQAAKPLIEFRPHIVGDSVPLGPGQVDFDLAVGAGPESQGTGPLNLIPGKVLTDLDRLGGALRDI